MNTLPHRVLFIKCAPSMKDSVKTKDVNRYSRENALALPNERVTLQCNLHSEYVQGGVYSKRYKFSGIVM